MIIKLTWVCIVDKVLIVLVDTKVGEVDEEVLDVFRVVAVQLKTNNNK